MNRLAVLGHPVAHSLSPRMQTAALEATGLADSWSYEAIEIAPAEFERELASLPGRGFVGANVTIPHKEAALRLADRASEEAVAIGAANTLSFAPEGIRADNTDAPGLLAALPEAPAGERALVLGAGGAARAAVWALARAGAEVDVLNRTASRAAAMVTEIGAGAAIPEGTGADPRDYGLIVNATAIGLEADPSSDPVAGFKAIGLAADQFNERMVVVDLVYGGTETGLLRAARERGARTVDGLEILVRQGAASFTIWTGLDAPLTAMREALHSRQ